MDNCPLSNKPCDQAKNFLFSETVNGDSTCFRLCHKCTAPSFNTMKMLTMKKNECPECGYSYEQIKKCGKLGCAECLKTFGDGIISVLRFPFNRVDASTGSTLDGEIKHQESLLAESIKEEKYENAAIFKGAIKTLNAVKDKVDILRKEMDEAVIKNEMDRAMELSQGISSLLATVLT